MSEFILPEDLRSMAERSAMDIAEGWAMLERLCQLRQYPFSLAQGQVDVYVKFAGLNELEALRKVYNEVAYS